MKRSAVDYSLIWFRSDLRITDNPIIQKNSIALFDIHHTFLGKHDWSKPKVDLLLRRLVVLRNQLNSLNIPLLVRHNSNIVELCKEIGVRRICFNKQYEVDEANRDRRLVEELKKCGIQVVMTEDQCLIPPNTLFTKKQTPFTVFTPFKNVWLKVMNDYLVESVKPVGNDEMPIENDVIPIAIEGFELEKSKAETLQTLWPAEEELIQKRVDDFLQKKIRGYDQSRDFPWQEGTSQLSPYFAQGIISVRMVLRRLEELSGDSLVKLMSNKGIATFVSELCWRDFYRDVLFNFPHVCKNQPFKEQGKHVQWRTAPTDFDAWCKGKTGYPIVDAGMRQLMATGWMHNRVRMITAMFLCKHLLINWQLGEVFFMQHLVDGDFASNNGGWQWSASTGTDAQPYFRVFNPTLQSEKFDANGDYIRKWVPELRDVKGMAIHEPNSKLSKSAFEALGYPKPIVEHKEVRERAIAEFKRAFAK